MKSYMNPQYGKHMADGGLDDAAEGESSGDHQTGQGDRPNIHIHSHSKGHTVHILHQDGRHEKHEHGHGDAEGIAGHIHAQLGGGGGPAAPKRPAGDGENPGAHEAHEAY